ncbi:MAG TPA: hypothetical protein VFD25_02830 [Clostridia bacterium]|nr:hypothetical protein [Clostridia bacterium]
MYIKNKQVESREYLADVIVAHTSGGTVFLYDIVNMNEINIAEVEKTGKHDNIANASRNLASTNKSGSNSAENVKENNENEKSSFREFKGRRGASLP